MFTVDCVFFSCVYAFFICWFFFLCISCPYICLISFCLDVNPPWSCVYLFYPLYTISFNCLRYISTNSSISPIIYFSFFIPPLISFFSSLSPMSVNILLLSVPSPCFSRYLLIMISFVIRLVGFLLHSMICFHIPFSCLQNGHASFPPVLGACIFPYHLNNYIPAALFFSCSTWFQPVLPWVFLYILSPRTSHRSFKVSSSVMWVFISSILLSTSLITLVLSSSCSSSLNSLMYFYAALM